MPVTQRIGNAGYSSDGLHESPIDSGRTARIGGPSMLDRLLNTDTFLMAQGALDGLSARHAAISDNIANVNTPGYKRKEVPFEDALAHAVRDQISPCTGASCGAPKPFTPQGKRDTDTA